MFINRDFLTTLRSNHSFGTVLLWGPRQVGKTRLLDQLDLKSPFLQRLRKSDKPKEYKNYPLFINLLFKAFMKRKFILFFVSCFLLYFPTLVFADPSHRIGVIAPLTGDVAAAGIAARNGFEMAIKDDPDLFKDITFVFDDSRHDSKTALSAFHKQRERDHVELIYNWGTEPSRALAPIAEQLNFPLIMLSHDPEVAVRKSFVARFINPGVDFAKSTATELSAHNVSKVSVVKTELTYFNDLSEGIRRSLPPGTSYQVEESVDPSAGDFRTIIARLKQNPPEKLGLLLQSFQINAFLRQAREVNYNPEIFGSDLFDSPNLMKNIGDMLDQAFFSNTDISSEFREKYRRRFGTEELIAFAGHSYDFANLLGRTIQSQRDAHGLDLFANLTKKPFQGVCGLITFIDSQEVGKYWQFPVKLKRIQGANIN